MDGYLKMSKKSVLEIILSKELKDKIQSLVERGEFKSRDDFIELACAEQLALRYLREKRAIVGKT